MRHQNFRQFVVRKAVHPADIGRDTLDPFEQFCPRFLVIRADGQLHHRLVGNDIMLEAAVKGTNGYHGWLERCDFPADNRLQRHDDFRAHHDRILAAMRRCAMRANSVDNDINAVGRAASNAFVD